MEIQSHTLYRKVQYTYITETIGETLYVHFVEISSQSRTPRWMICNLHSNLVVSADTPDFGSTIDYHLRFLEVAVCSRRHIRFLPHREVTSRKAPGTAPWFPLGHPTERKHSCNVRWVATFFIKLFFVFINEQHSVSTNFGRMPFIKWYKYEKLTVLRKIHPASKMSA